VGERMSGYGALCLIGIQGKMVWFFHLTSCKNNNGK